MKTILPLSFKVEGNFSSTVSLKEGEGVREREEDSAFSRTQKNKETV